MDRTTHHKFLTLFFSITLPLYVIDQITKWWVVFRFSELQNPAEDMALTSWFHLGRVHNQGVAFGMGNGSTWAPIVFLFVPVIALFLIRYFWRQNAFPTLLTKIAVALLVAGVLGNLTDRLFQGFFLTEYEDASFLTRLSKGYVVDFIKVWLPGFAKIMPASNGWWPTFNVADSCVCTAAALLFFSSFQEQKKSA